MQDLLKDAIELTQKRDFAAAEKIFAQLAEKQSSNAGLFVHYGLCLSAQGKYKEALAEHLHAISLDASWPPPHLHAALEFRNTGNFEKAFEHFQKHLQLSPESVDGYLNYGDALMVAGKRSLAMQNYLSALKINSPLTEAALLELYLKCLAVKEASPDCSSFRNHSIFAELIDTFFQGVVKPFSKSYFWGDRLLTLDKTKGFLNDPAFAKANSERLLETYDQFSPPNNIEWRLNTLVWAGRQALRLAGDFVECGVFRGDMSWVVAQCLNFSEIDKIFYLYDSFSGFSAELQTPEDYPHNPSFLAFANQAYSADPNLATKVEERFSIFPNVRVIPGYVPDSFQKGLPEKIAYLHLDLNSPGAEIAALEVLFDRIVPGGIIVFDDYGWVDFCEQKKLEDAWFRTKGLSVLELPNGQGMVIKV